MIRKGEFVKLAAVPGKDKKLEGTAKRVNTARETTRLARQAGQIVAEFGIVALDGVGLAFVGQGVMVARIVDQRLVERVGFRVVLLSLLRAAVKDRLHRLAVAFPHCCPADNAARRPVNKGYDVGGVFSPRQR